MVSLFLHHFIILPAFERMETILAEEMMGGTIQCKAVEIDLGQLGVFSVQVHSRESTHISI